jgi:head-tail adaptor
MVPAGKLDRLIQFEERVNTREAKFNAATVSWVPFGLPTWARVIESSQQPGSNPGAAEGVAIVVKPMKVIVRWRGDIDHNRMRINYGGRLLRITGAAEIGRREDLELACQEWGHQQHG